MTLLGWAQSWSIARRDLHANFRGLRLLFICLLLGVGTLATISSLTAAISDELAARGRELLGGDVEIAMTQREASQAEKTAFRRLGQMSETIRMRAMAQRADGVAGGTGTPMAVLSELKGVDNLYPLYGRLQLRHGPRQKPLKLGEIVIGQALADRLHVTIGDRLRFGAASFHIADIIAVEPDRVSEGFTLGPVAIVSLDSLRQTALIQPGSLYESKYRIRLPANADAKQVGDRLKARYPSMGWEIKDRDHAAPGANRFFERMGQFLSLIGLTALIIAGIGVGNGVSSYLTLKRSSIATFKVLGATSGDIARIYLLQIATVALLAIGCGLVVGALLPPLLVALAGDMLPVRPGLALYPLPLMTSAAYGLLIALIFILPPLARARTEPAAALFRAVVEQRRALDRRALLMLVAAMAAVIALALGTAHEVRFSAAVLGAIAAVLLLLLGIGWAVRLLAARLPRPRNPLLRLAVANLHRPVAQTPALVIALGLALTLFVTLAAIQTCLDAEISRNVPKTAPNQFVLDIPADAKAHFVDLVRQEAPEAKLNIIPALRGTIIAYGPQRVADLKELPNDAWFLRGERGVTYSETLPEGSDLLEGQWWPKSYQGAPLVSLDAKVAKTMNVRIGDTLTVSVLGRDITARIASLRQINWDNMGFNYIMVFSPNTLAHAPHSLAATITMQARHEASMSRTLLAAFPSASIIAVGDIVDQVSKLLRQMSSAIVAAASVAILAGIAVLVGAIAASRQARSYDSVVLKTLGATRAQILTIQALEYGLLAIVLALVSLGLGTLAAWFVVVEIFSFDWAPDWVIVLGTLAVGMVMTLGIGLIGSLPLISLRPAQALRQM
ncbi:ABC transporter permease [Aquisediminimonas sediminicola]|uniref:ABC transporter permease n=1 Tax=Alteraquisediminimonas sediminicola TaxID=2676787 RepID=UPI001C8D2FC1|nr:FtsX-like permease family protein [Aquisediminimonas sediminicola]